jgi:hypothetical protein
MLIEFKEYVNVSRWNVRKIAASGRQSKIVERHLNL